MRIDALEEKRFDHIPVVMVREDLSNLPVYALPEGYRLRYYREGEDCLWVDIEIAVGSFHTVDSAFDYFEKEFGPGREEMEERCLYLETEDGQAIGTSTAWYNSDFNGRDHGRIHWVAVRPEFQGKGLARPLLAASLSRIAELHERAYLTTQTTSARAINLYLDFGFIPFETYDRCREGWQLLADVLNHPELATYRA